MQQDRPEWGVSIPVRAIQKVISKGVHDGAGLLIAAWVREEVDRLIDDDQVVVFEDDVKRDVLGHCRGRFAGIELDFYVVAGLKDPAGHSLSFIQECIS